MMKAIQLFLLMVSVSLVANAQDSILVEKSKAWNEALKGQRQILKSNPLPMLWGPIILTNEYRLIYEIPVAPRQAIMMGVSYLGKGPLFQAIWESNLDSVPKQYQAKWIQLGKDARMNGIRVQGMYRFYLTKKHLAPRGIYIGPQASYSTVKITWASHPDFYFKFNNFNVNFFAGAQGILWDVLAVDVFTGIGYKSNTYEAPDANGKILTGNATGITGHVENLKLSLGVNFGYAF